METSVQLLPIQDLLLHYIQCEILNISQPYKSPGSVKGIALLLLYFYINVTDKLCSVWLSSENI
jgi:hypothetical protein